MIRAKGFFFNFQRLIQKPVAVSVVVRGYIVGAEAAFEVADCGVCGAQFGLQNFQRQLVGQNRLRVITLQVISMAQLCRCEGGVHIIGPHCLLGELDRALCERQGLGFILQHIPRGFSAQFLRLKPGTIAFISLARFAYANRVVPAGACFNDGCTAMA